MDIFPAIDVLAGRVVRLTRGRYDDATTYADDAAGQARGFAAAGARMVHVVDLEGARSGTRDRRVSEAMREVSIRYQLGGGIRTADDAASAMAAGATRVVMGTAAVWSSHVIVETLTAIGGDALVVALDVREGRARGAGWQDDGMPVDEVAGRLADQGVRRCIVTGIERDGTMTGPDLELVQLVRDAAPGMAVIASGGVTSVADVTSLAAAGCEAAIVGKALYEGRLTLRDAIAAGL